MSRKNDAKVQKPGRAKSYTPALARMNTGNWKTAINGRDRKKRGSNKSGASEPAVTESEQSEVGADQNESGQKQILARPKVDKQNEDVKVAAEPAPVKLTWGEMSEGPDIGVALKTFSDEYNARCHTLKDKLDFISSMANLMFARASRAIDEERDRIEKSKNEKSFVRDLHDISSNSRDLVSSAVIHIREISLKAERYESEKVAALDELKKFVATLDTKNNEKHGATQAEQMKRKPVDSKYAVAAGASGTESNPIPRSGQNAVVDSASVQFKLGNLSLPMSRDQRDVGPMMIKFAPSLGVFLINLDGKIYSFCDGAFVSRTPKSGDNTLFGKRCNPSIARCVGEACTYYHDPLSYSNGHTKRNMGVHYVVSELINGVSSDNEILETAHGRNKYIVEDIVQLAGMLLIKAFLVKKVRDRSHGSRGLHE